MISNRIRVLIDLRKKLERETSANRVFNRAVWALFLVSLIYFAMFFQDDALIHLRYAEHLAASGRWAFNTGEPSYGASSPLFVLVLAALVRVGLSSVWLPKLLSVAFYGLLVAQFLKLCRTDSEHSSGLRALTILLVMPMSALVESSLPFANGIVQLNPADALNAGE